MTDMLTIKNLKVGFLSNNNTIYKAINGVDLTVQSGETFALVGESGSGKSLTSLAINRLLPQNAYIGEGSIINLNGENILKLSEEKMRTIRGRRVAMIFQETMTSLNPVMTVRQQLTEAMTAHFNLSRNAKYQRCLELLEAVGLPEPKLQCEVYPHELSGGMRQRVMIAMVLAMEPELLIADEPTTALDVTIQAQILSLLKNLQKKTGMSILLITHDLGVVREMADTVAVMYAGHIIEQASVEQFFSDPKHPYSIKLFSALPSIEKHAQMLDTIKGVVPPIYVPRLPCRFADRCDYAWNSCHKMVPQWILVDKNHRVRCHMYGELNKNNIKIGDRYNLPEPEALRVHTAQYPLIEVRDLKIYFSQRRGLFKKQTFLKAVDGVSLNLIQGRTIAIVGESGSGKTTLSKAILRLQDTTDGKIIYDGDDITNLDKKALSKYRQAVQIIFQDPFSSMNPKMSVIDILSEGMNAQSLYQKNDERQNRLTELLSMVGLPKDSLYRYPHEFSGGQRQRLCIARALSVNPRVIVCDEPTSALDVSIQAQILNLLKNMQHKFGLTYLFISHNLSVVAYMADEIVVMKNGKIVEQGTVNQIVKTPEHPYTKQLLSSAPVLL